ncbi:MAG: lysophospholipid acyltransferase family protein [Anaerolineales bacterium]
MFRRILRLVFGLGIRLLTRRQVENGDRIPDQGPYILAANHLSYFDLPLLFGLMGGPNVTGWAAEKYQRHPIFGLIVRMGGGIFIQRGQVDRKAMADAVAWLQAGNIFGVAPEGTRSRTGQLQRGKTGVVYLAQEAGVPILPVGLYGTENVISSWSRLRRPVLNVVVGELFRLPPLDEDNRSANLRQQSDEIMLRIAALLPPSYRGYYADHPRLSDFLTH